MIIPGNTLNYIIVMNLSMLKDMCLVFSRLSIDYVNSEK